MAATGLSAIIAAQVGSIGCGSAEARHIARAAQRQLLLCDAHRRRSSSPWLLKWSCRHAVVRRDVAMSACELRTGCVVTDD